MSAAISFEFHGAWTYSAIIFGFAIVPVIELLVRPQSENLSNAEKELVSKDWLYDVLVFTVVPMQLAFLVWFLVAVREPGLSGAETWGRITAMGMMCGVFGINVAHELGHRQGRFAKWNSLLLLLSSLYMHFYIEHNKGHHKKVATPEDPATARFGENIYVFWIRTIVTSYISAWKIQTVELNRANRNFLHSQNEMLWFHLIQGALLVGIYLLGGWWLVLYFALAAFLGILLLETVNYIEHYGLLRRLVNANRYENVLPIHSWNSDHVMGRLMLFELTRHSDHHHNSQKKYQALDSRTDAPQLPTGYPGMMVLSLVPPLWFAVMNKRASHLMTDSSDQVQQSTS